MTKHNYHFPMGGEEVELVHGVDENHKFNNILVVLKYMMLGNEIELEDYRVRLAPTVDEGVMPVIIASMTKDGVDSETIMGHNLTIKSFSEFVAQMEQDELEKIHKHILETEAR